MTTTTSTKPLRERAKQQPRKSRTDKLDQYKSEAKEIAAAKQAMQRLHRGVEFEPERLHYVIDLHSL